MSEGFQTLHRHYSRNQTHQSNHSKMKSARLESTSINQNGEIKN
jgi:hypothetical protein